MTIAEKLMAKGRAEGEARGEARGKAAGAWMGKVQLLEQLMRLPQTPEHILSGIGATELERRYHELQRQYDVQFKSNG